MSNFKGRDIPHLIMMLNTSHEVFVKALIEGDRDLVLLSYRNYTKALAHVLDLTDTV